MSRFRAAVPAVAAGILVLTVGAPGSAVADVADPSFAPLTRAEAEQRPVLRIGDEGVWVRRLHRALRVRPVKAPFDAKTARAVMRFRVSAGLSRRPVVDARTWMELGSRVTVPSAEPAPTSPPPPPPADAAPELGYGDTSPWVAAAQTALGVTPATGYFGPVTRAAVTAFQRAHGLMQTGRLDAATWHELGDRVTRPETDITTTELARTSRSHRATVGVRAFVSSWTARKVVERESGGDCAVSSPGGTYRGKWQMNADFWRTYGGLEFAGSPDLATCEQQDLVAYRGWVDRWWQPWAGTAL